MLSIVIVLVKFVVYWAADGASKFSDVDTVARCVVVGLKYILSTAYLARLGAVPTRFR